MSASGKPTVRGKREDETAYLLRSPANAARLAEAIAEIEAGRARRRLFQAMLRESEAEADREGTHSAESVAAEAEKFFVRRRGNRRSRRRIP